MTAGALLEQARKMPGHDEDAPGASGEDRSWRERLLAASLQGALFAGGEAAGNRAGPAA
ncbi:DUF4235 domain-containing protein [Streptomyces sp. NPDC005890]|uniref:DUF4235 domain-containing protein n=1 Tax=Streptomyces sp. NPDC005890 TaxID=3154568 RepID=UPI003402A23A